MSIGTTQRFTAEVKKYDPDFEDEQVFDTAEEAAEWLREQNKYGQQKMWINNEQIDQNRLSEDFKRIFGK